MGLTGETTNVVPSDGLNVLSSITSEFDEIVSDLSMLFLEVCFLGPTRIIIICIEIISSWTGTILVVARNRIIIVDSNVCNESSFSKESLWFMYLICVFF